MPCGFQFLFDVILVVFFLWIMLHLLNHTYCILCWDSHLSPLWVWFVGSLWDLAKSLHINYYINWLTPWLVGLWLILSYCFPYITLLKHAVRQSYILCIQHTQRQTPCVGIGVDFFCLQEYRSGGSLGPVQLVISPLSKHDCRWCCWLRILIAANFVFICPVFSESVWKE